MSSLPLTQNITDSIVRLSERTLAFSRLAWIVICVSATVTFFLALPFRWNKLMHPSSMNLANMNALGISVDFFAACSIFGELVIALPYIIVGFVIYWRCGEERIALFTSLVLVVFGVGSGTITPTIRSLLGLNPAIDLLQHTFEFISWLGFGLFFYVFPNGRFVPAWTRWLAALWIPVCIVWNYFPDSPFAPLNWDLLLVPFVGLFWASWMFSQIYRYRRAASAIERQQTKWVVYAIVVIIAFMLITSMIGAFVPGYDLMSEQQTTPEAFAYMFWQWTASPLMAALPVGIAFSIMRYRLWDIDQLISRTLVYGALTMFVVAAYVLIVGGLGTLFQASGNLFFSILATGVIAVLFNPLRQRLQRVVDHLLYGERDDPYTVLSQINKNLKATMASDSALSSIVETIAQTLKLPYVAIILRDGDSSQVAAYFGFSKLCAVVLPLMYQRQFIGELHVAPRSTDEPFTAAEHRLLEDIAAQTGIAVHNVQLATDLQRSREQIVAAREEERRRLRRDLHDGLGPKLAGQTLKLEAALDSLDGETETARALLKETMSESQTVIAEIRRLVYGLRPPALDQLGLLTSLREQAAQYQSTGLQVTVSAPDALPTLPAAIEVAGYRIVQEALTNVARHAHARTCTVSLTIKQDLEIEITDDGIGLKSNQRAGVGLSSMRERAEEIGGSCVIQPGTNGGTRVIAKLPITNLQSSISNF